MLKCPYCLGESFIKTTRNFKDETIRLRMCKRCHRHFYTAETILDEDVGRERLREFYTQVAREKRRRQKLAHG